MELIKITDHNGDQAVSARELHSFLEVTERFGNWCERMFQYGFVEGVDYTPLTFLHPQNKQELGDYILTLDTAKEISMLQRTDKGKQARQYFIQCEKAVQMIRAKSLTTKELAQMVIDAENAREEAEKRLAIQQPKVDYVKAVLQSNSFRTVNEIATDLGMTANKLNATLHAHQIQYKQGGVWMLYAKYRSCGYAFSRTDLKNGHTYTQLVWTEKGRAFIHAILNPVMIHSIQTKNNQVNLLQN
jgi:anti-repressor protein